MAMASAYWLSRRKVRLHQTPQWFFGGAVIQLDDGRIVGLVELRMDV
jgi:hypothetical protein